MRNELLKQMTIFVAGMVVAITGNIISSNSLEQVSKILSSVLKSGE